MCIDYRVFTRHNTNTLTQMYVPCNLGDLERGEATTCQKGNLVASVWKDKKLVYVMSTNCQPEGATSVQRRNRDGSVQQVPCPPSVVEYNRYMGGVDKADQLRGYYRVRCKSRKFYRYIFWFLFDACVVNAFVLFRHFVPVVGVTCQQATVRNFRLRLATGLIGQYNSRKRYCLPEPVRQAAVSSTPPKRRREDTATPSHADGHFPTRGKRSRCEYCWRKENRRYDSGIRCRKCGKAFCIVARDAPLDGPSCFERYHTEFL